MSRSQVHTEGRLIIEFIEETLRIRHWMWDVLNYQEYVPRTVMQLAHQVEGGTCMRSIDMTLICRRKTCKRSIHY